MTLDRPKEQETKRVKGSVLFTVLVVLLVLIAFLVGTLGIATAANRRSQNAFTSSQAQYTARSVVDGVVMAMKNVEDFKEAIDALPDYDPNDPDSSKVVMDSTQVHLPLDQSYGEVQEVEIARQPSQYSFDETKQQWQEVNVLKVTATVRSGKEVSSYSTYITSAIEAKESTVPPTADRVLTGGTAAISTPSLSVGANVSTYGGAAIGFDIPSLLGTNLGPYKYSVPANGVNLGNAGDGNVFEAPFSVFGTAGLNGNVITLSFPSVATGFTFWGDFNIQNGCLLQTGNDLLKNTTRVNYSEMPYIYVEGTLNFQGNSQQMCRMPEDFPLMLIIGKFEQQSSAGYTLPGDVYCLDTGTTSLKFNNSGALNAWTGNLVNGTNNDLSHYCGGYYSPGSLSMDGTGTFRFNGDVVIDGDFTMNQNVIVEGDLIVMGKMTNNTGSKDNLTVNGILYYNTTEGYLTNVNPDGGTISDNDDVLNSPAYTTNKAVYDRLAAVYGANKNVWTGLLSNMTNAVDGTLFYNVYPWYMQKTWMLGLFDENTAGINEFSMYTGGSGTAVSRQIVKTPNDVATEQYDTLKNACATKLPDAYAAVDPIEITKPGTYVPTPEQPYFKIVGETEQVADPTTGYEIVIDLANSALDEAWLVIEDGVSFSNKPFAIVMNDLDASGQYMETKVLNILITGNVKADNQFAGIFTKYYQNTLLKGSGSFYIPTGVAAPAGATELRKPNIYIYSDVFPYIESNGQITLDPNAQYRDFNTATNGTYFMSAYAFAPGLKMNMNKAENDSLKNDVIYYNGSPIKNTSGAGNSWNVSVIGGLLLGESDAGDAGKPVVVYYPSSVTVLPGQEGFVQDNKLQWFEEYQQNSYDAY